MAKELTIVFNDKEYRLGFDRDSVRTAERRGLEVTKITDQPVTQIPLLVHAAFLKNHRWVSSDEAQSIYNEIPNKDQFLGKLMELYNEPIAELVGGTEEDTKEKNAMWEANW